MQKVKSPYSRHMLKLLLFALVVVLLFAVAPHARAEQIANADISFVNYRHDYPYPGTSTWYYAATDKAYPSPITQSISHISFGANLAYGAVPGCSSLVFLADNITWFPGDTLPNLTMYTSEPASAPIDPGTIVSAMPQLPFVTDPEDTNLPYRNRGYPFVHVGTWDGVDYDSITPHNNYVQGDKILVDRDLPNVPGVGLKYEIDFNGGETRYFYFVLDGNYDVVDNLPANVKIGPASFGGTITGPSPTCAETGALDWGDDPDTNYQTNSTSSGAFHLVTGPYLGACVDTELDGQESAGADGDNLAVGATTVGTCAVPGNDEDGVVQTSDLNGGTGDFNVSVAGGPACLNMWLDFTDGASILLNGDGDFDDTYTDATPTDFPEHVVMNQPVVTGLNAVSFPLPAGVATNANWYLRVRLTPEDAAGGCGLAEAYSGFSGTASSSGYALGGEVEDYRVLGPTAITLQGATVATDAGMLIWVWLAVILTLAFVTFIVLRRRAQPSQV